MFLNFKTPAEKVNIYYSELNNKYSVVGPLGIALGKVVVLEVKKIKLNVKSDPPTLLVKKINGKKLKKPIQLKYQMLIIDDKFILNKTYKIKGYQDGSFTGTPYEVMKDLLMQTTDYYFEVSLVVFKYL